MQVNLVLKIFIIVKLSFLEMLNLRKKLEKISKEEKVHYDYFEDQILKKRVRPTINVSSMESRKFYSWCSYH